MTDFSITDDTCDPIFTTIAAHQEAARTTDDAYAHLLAVGAPLADDHDRLRDAHMGELRATDVMVETAPTTRAGLQALSAHLGDERHRGAHMRIQRTETLDDGGTYTQFGGDGAVEWLLASRAAGIC